MLIMTKGNCNKKKAKNTGRWMIKLTYLHVDNADALCLWESVIEPQNIFTIGFIFIGIIMNNTIQ